MEEEIDRQAELEEHLKHLQDQKKSEEENKEKMLRKAKSILENQREYVRLESELRKINKELEKSKRGLRTAEDRRKLLIEKMQDLLGDDDPGDGTGEMAKIIILSKIESIEQTDMNEKLDELSIENEYHEDLQRQWQLLEATWNLLQEKKETDIKELQKELEECQGDGYMAMLKEECNDLIRKRAKL